MAHDFNIVATLAELPLKRRERAAGLGADETNVSMALGLNQLGASYFEVKPGEAAYPFHAHYNEDELIFIVAGVGAYRFGDETLTVKAGDMLSAPAGGAEVAHQLTNSGDETLKYFCVSNLPEINVAELPDKGEVHIHSRREGGPESVRVKKP